MHRYNTVCKLKCSKIDLISKHRHSSKKSSHKPIHRPASQRQWSLLLQHHNSLLPSTRQISHEFFNLSARQCPSTQNMQAGQISWTQNSCIHITPDLRQLNNLGLNPVDYKIWVIIQHWVHLTKVQDVNDLNQHLTDVWAGIKQSTPGTVINWPVVQTSPCLHSSQIRTLWIFTVTKISQIIVNFIN